MERDEGGAFNEMERGKIDELDDGGFIPKSEGRNPRSERNPKSETQIPPSLMPR
jgi:hypothetical protein